MPKHAIIVEPYEMVQYAETKYGINNIEANDLVCWIRPEYEVKTRTFELIDEEQDLQDYLDGFEDPSKEINSGYVRAHQMLIDYMKDNNFTEFTMTQ